MSRTPCKCQEKKNQPERMGCGRQRSRIWETDKEKQAHLYSEEKTKETEWETVNNCDRDGQWELKLDGSRAERCSEEMELMTDWSRSWWLRHTAFKWCLRRWEWSEEAMPRYAPLNSSSICICSTNSVKSSHESLQRTMEKNKETKTKNCLCFHAFHGCRLKSTTNASNILTT